MLKPKLRQPSNSIVQILAENVKSLRLAKGLSQEQLAAICGLHRTYVGSVERGERNVTLSTLEILSRGLGIGVPELLSKKRSRDA
jgi:transcriptional regulator with XRE-family HTH domain